MVGSKPLHPIMAKRHREVEAEDGKSQGSTILFEDLLT
jgi:hypothetical protein